MKKWLLFATGLFALLVVILVIGADTDRLPEAINTLYEYMALRIQRWNKYVNLFLFGLLSFLLNLSALTIFPKENPARLTFRVTLLLALLIGLEEWSQSLFPTRKSSIEDLIASYMGVFPSALLAYLTSKPKLTPEESLYIKKWLPIATLIFGFLLLLLVIVVNTGQMPSLVEKIYHLPRGDKFGHLILFGVLSFLMNLSALTLFPKRNPAHLILVVTLLLALLIGLEEWSQSLFPTRTVSIKDLIASYLGVFPSALLAYWTKQSYL